MDEGSLLELMKNWGYYLLPQSHRDSPGCAGVLVVIREQPTGKHFDPKKLYLPLRDVDGIARWTKLSWSSPTTDSNHVCPGRVILSDRFDKRVEFFTFGGSLEVTSGLGEMVCSLHSPAPVLELVAQQETIPDQLASETEALMGKIRARWYLDDKGFNQRLAEVNPLQFYLATLQSILFQYEHTPALEEVYHELRDSLLREKAWLVAKDLWPANPPRLEDLLAPGSRLKHAAVVLEE
jgi:hypothetical protein